MRLLTSWSSLIVPLALALAGCQFKVDRQLGPGEIRAHVVFLGSNGAKQDAPQATVRIENSSIGVTADARGDFVIRELQAGSYALDITWAPAGGDTPRGLRLRNIALDPGVSGGLAVGRDLGDVEIGAFGSITGTVTSTAAIPQGTVVTMAGLALMDAQSGTYQSPSLPPGDYDLTLFSPVDGGARVTDPVTVTVTPGRVATAPPFNLDTTPVVTGASGSISGTVLLVGAGSNGGSSVLLDPQPAGFVAPETDPSGLYSITSIQPGLYTVTAQVNDKSASVFFVVVGGNTTTVPVIVLALDDSQSLPDGGTGTDGGSVSGDGGPTDGGSADAGGGSLPDGGSCPGQMTPCGGTCVDLETDNNNCGFCGNVCPAIPSGLTGACTYGACLVTLNPSVQWDANDIAVDSSSIYWDNFDGQIVSEPLVGGTPATLGSWSSDSIGGLALDTSNIYWADTFGVFSMSKQGGTASTLLSRSGSRWRTVTDGSSVYWTDTTGVYGVTLAGAVISTLSTVTDAYGLGVDSTSVYFTQRSVGNVMSVGKTGGTPATLASGQDTPYDLRVQAPYVYWVNYDAPPTGVGAVMRVALTGGIPQTMSVNAEANFPQGITVDSNFVYWSNYGTGTVYAAPLDGQPAFRVTAQQANPLSMAIDANHIYWSTPTALVYAPKPGAL
jgi:hypothetical protein